MGNFRVPGARRRVYYAGGIAFALTAAFACGALAAQAIPGPGQASGVAALAELSADRIVEKSIAARGGLHTWLQVDSLVWVGHIESERLGEQKVKFSLEEKRPNKTRFDIISAQPSVRIFNGTKGWKTHTRNDGFPDVEPYSPLEERFAREAPGLGGVTVTCEQGTSLSLQRGLGGLDADERTLDGSRRQWKILGASRGEGGILGEGVRQALLRDPTYLPALNAARELCPA